MGSRLVTVGAVSDAVNAADAWRAAAEIGPYFAVEPTRPDGEWLTLRSLIEDETALSDRVVAARELLAERCGLTVEAIDLRATASIQFLGVAARLVSPALAVAVLTGAVPELDPDTVHWRPLDGGPVPMALSAASLTAAGPEEDLAAQLYNGVIATCVAPLAAAVQRRFSLSPKIVWGNVASALGGAANMLGTARPDLAVRATDLVDRLLGQGKLVGSGRFVRSTGRMTFLRNNCCLFYRVPGGGTCGDCVLITRR